MDVYGLSGGHIYNVQRIDDLDPSLLVHVSFYSVYIYPAAGVSPQSGFCFCSTGYKDEADEPKLWPLVCQRRDSWILGNVSGGIEA